MDPQPKMSTEPARSEVPEFRVWTDQWGQISHISAPAASLIGFSALGATGRQLALFFVSDRTGIIRDMRSAREGLTIERIHTLKPREKRSLAVRVEIARDEQNPDHLQWRLQPVAGGPTRSSGTR